MPSAVLTATRAYQGVDTILTRIRFAHKTFEGVDHEYLWAGIGITHFATGEYTEERAVEIGDLIVQLSDRNGRSQDSTCTVTLSDLPDPTTGEMLLRGFLGSPTTVALLGVEVSFETTTHADLVAGNDWVKLFRGLVRSYEMPADYLFTIEVESWLAPRKAQPVIARTAGDAFLGAPAATFARVAPWWYGRRSDAPSSGGPIVAAAEAASGAGVGGGGVAEIGYGVKGIAGPASSSASDIGGGSLAAGTYRMIVTAIVGGVETDPDYVPYFNTGGTSVVVGASGKIDAICAAVPGATAYHFYFTDPGDTYRYGNKVTSATNSATWDGMNHTGPDITTIWYYAVIAELPDGLTAPGVIWQAVNVGPVRILRAVWEPVVGATAYYVYRRGATYERRWTVPATQLNGDGNVYFEDTQAAAQDTMIPVNGIPTPMGRVPAFPVGPVTSLTGAVLQAFAIAGTAMVGLLGDLYNVASDDVATVIAGVGSSVFYPGASGWSTHFGADLFYTGTDGSRWFIVAFESTHPDLGDADGLGGLLDGTTTLRVNLEGIEDIGDGTGGLIDAIDDQIAHLADNILLRDDGEQLGDWVTSVPTYSDGAPRRDVASFATAAVNATIVFGASGRASSFGITQAITWDGLLADLMISAGAPLAAYGFSQAGQLVYVVTNPDANATVELTERDEILQRGFSGKDDRTGFFNVLPYQFDARYGNDGGLAAYAAIATPLRDSASLVRYRKIGAQTDTMTSLLCVSSAGQALQLMGQRLRFSATPPRTVPVLGGWHWIHKSLGEVVGLTHRQGFTATGWENHRVVLRAIRMASGALQCQLTCLDLPSATVGTPILEDLMVILGGSHDESVVDAGDGANIYRLKNYIEGLVPWAVFAAQGVSMMATPRLMIKTDAGTVIAKLYDESNVLIATATSVTSSTFTAVAGPAFTDTTSKRYHWRLFLSGGAQPDGVFARRGEIELAPA